MRAAQAAGGSKTAQKGLTREPETSDFEPPTDVEMTVRKRRRGGTGIDIRAVVQEIQQKKLDFIGEDVDMVPQCGDEAVEPIAIDSDKHKGDGGNGKDDAWSNNDGHGSGDKELVDVLERMEVDGFVGGEEEDPGMEVDENDSVDENECVNENEPVNGKATEGEAFSLRHYEKS